VSIEWMIALLGILLGGMTFVTALVAPIIFIVLDESDATRFTRMLWPRYFLVNAVVAGFGGALLAGIHGRLYTGFVLLIITGLMIVNWILARRMQTMRDPEDQYVRGSTYDWYHSVTVWTNGLSILLAAGIIVVLILLP